MRNSKVKYIAIPLLLSILFSSLAPVFAWEIEGSGEVTVIISYDQKSLRIKNRWENAYLVSISREELEENREEIVKILKKPVELSTIRKTLLSEAFRICAEETLSEVLKEVFPKDVISKIVLDIADGNYKNIPPDALKAFLTFSQRFFILRASELIVEVKDGKGRPVENATITLSSKDFGNFTKITNASGVAEFEIPRANYTIKALKKGYLPYEETLDLSEVATSTKVIQLKLPFWQEYQFYIVGIVIFFIASSITVMLLKRRKRVS